MYSFSLSSGTGSTNTKKKKITLLFFDFLFQVLLLFFFHFFSGVDGKKEKSEATELISTSPSVIDFVTHAVTSQYLFQTLLFLVDTLTWVTALEKTLLSMEKFFSFFEQCENF